MDDQEIENNNKSMVEGIADVVSGFLASSFGSYDENDLADEYTTSRAQAQDELGAHKGRLAPRVATRREAERL